MRPLAEKVGNRIYLRVPYSSENVARCKSVPGARWSKKARSWTYPLDLETARMLREEWSDDLELGPELMAWGRSETKRESQLTSVGNVQGIDVMKKVHLPIVAERCPGMWEAMMNRPYQPVASYFMATARQCLNGDQPGIGKTIETLGALVEAEVVGPVLVLAPRTSVRSVWEPEIDRWLETLDVTWSLTVALGSKRKIEQAYEDHAELVEEYPDGIHFLVANAEQVRIQKSTICPEGICDGDEDWCPEKDKHKNQSTVRKPYLHKVKWSAIIADETHRWLINTRGKKASQVGYGFTKLQTNETDVRFALTGTPLKGKKHNLFGTLNWLRPKVYTAKWRWIETWFETFDEGWSKSIGDLKPDKKDAFFRSLGTVMIRRTKDELRAIDPSWMPPEKRYHDVWVDLDGKQATHYKAMERAAEVMLEGGRLGATGVLAEMTRLKQFAGCDGVMNGDAFVPVLPSAKFDWLVQFLEERGIEKEPAEEVQKVVVASQFTSMIKVWAKELEAKGIPVLMITGETKRPEEVSAMFQNDDEHRVLLINTQAGGVSITLDRADDMVIMDETWVPDEQEQVEDRIHRASNVEHQVDIWYVRARGTVEEGIAQTNFGKAESNHVVLDARRGLRFAAERFGSAVKEKENK